jgi:tetratricopeptide (TPR) repeat protein
MSYLQQQILANLGQARDLMDQGQLVEAISLYKEIMSLDPTNQEVSRSLAVAQEKQGDGMGAIESYVKTLKISEQQPIWVYLNLGKQLTSQNCPHEALLVYHRALKIYPDHATAHRLLAFEQEKQGDVEASIASYQRTLQLAPQQSAGIYFRLGKLLLDCERLDEASAVHHQALELHADEPDVYRLLAVVQERQNQPSEAIGNYRKAIAMDAQQPVWVYLNLSRLLNEQNQPEEALHWCNEAIQLYPARPEATRSLALLQEQTGNIEGSIVSYRQLLALDPQQPNWVYWNLGKVLRGQERFNEAIALYQAAAMVYPDGADAYRFLGEVQSAAGQTENAIASYRQALHLNPESPVWVYFTLGNLLAQQERLHETIELYQQALNFHAENPEVYRQLGTAQKQQGDENGAIASYRQSLRLKPDSPPWVYFSLCTLLTQQEQWQEAVALYQQALQFHPDNADVYRQLATAQKQQGDEAGAIGNYRRTIELNPDSPAWVFFTLAQLLSSQNQIEEAIHLYEEAIRVEPENPEGYRLLGVVQDMAGQTEKAIASYRQAIDMQPEGPIWVYYTLGQSLTVQEQLDDAIAVYEKAAQVYPNDSEVYRQMANVQKKRVMLTES